VNQDVCKRCFSYLICAYTNITIRASYEKSTPEVEMMLGDKIRWIINKQKEYEYRHKDIIKPTFLPDSTLPYLGKNYPIKLVTNTPNNKTKTFDVIIDNSFFLVVLDTHENEKKNKEKTSNIIKGLYTKWLEEQAKKILKEKITKYSKTIQVTPSKFIIKNLRNRWGSITQNDTINLNVNLLKAPEDVIDYIIIHELCHIKIKGHSQKFWQFLNRFITKYQDKIEWLSRNGENLLS
jgi:predicted metal-dependent hydrolase